MKNSSLHKLFTFSTQFCMLAAITLYFGGVAFADDTVCKIDKEGQWRGKVERFAPSEPRATVAASGNNYSIQVGKDKASPLGDRGNQAGRPDHAYLDIGEVGDPSRVDFYLGSAWHGINMGEDYSFTYILSGKGCADLIKKHRDQLVNDLWTVVVASPEGADLKLSKDLDRNTFHALASNFNNEFSNLSDSDLNAKVETLKKARLHSCGLSAVGDEAEFFTNLLKHTLSTEWHESIYAIKNPIDSMKHPTSTTETASEKTLYEQANVSFRKGGQCWEDEKRLTQAIAVDAHRIENFKQHSSDVNKTVNKSGVTPVTQPGAEPVTDPHQAVVGE